MRIAVLFAGLLLISCLSFAAELPWSDKRIQYAVVETKDLRVFLREFAAQQGVAVWIDPEVKGELTGRYDLSPRSMLELVTRNYGLIHYFDGRVLYIYPATAVLSEVIKLNEITPKQFRRTLDRLGISDARYPIAADSERNTILVSGPKRYVELVKQAARSSDRMLGASDSSLATRIFPLRFAFADDYAFVSGGKEYRLPGIVSILKQSFRGEASAGQPIRREDLARRQPLDAVGSEFEGDVASLPLLQPLKKRPTAPKPSFEELSDEWSPGRSAPKATPFFSADPRTNSVIVRDYAMHMNDYEAVIARLDERPKVLELEANILEVNTDDLLSLGIDWKVSGSKVQANVGSAGIADPIVNPFGTSPDPALPLSPVRLIGTVAGGTIGFITNDISSFAARISALEQVGRASVQAQPKIMTLNNVEAVLESTKTFYARVAGFQDSQLFDINVGTSIRVMPSVVSSLETAPVQEQPKDVIRMLIRIEDGALTDQRIDQLPVVQRSRIGTQAMVPDGSTLLLAGYSQDKESSSNSGVPGLSRIPILGNLFKSRAQSKSKVERFFMITPRVVDIGNLPSAPGLK
jgi:type III secretion protein C